MKIKKMLLYVFATLFSYLTLSIIVHHYLMPMKKIDYNTYFKPGDTFNSISEGFNQTFFHKMVIGWVYIWKYNLMLSVRWNTFIMISMKLLP